MISFLTICHNDFLVENAHHVQRGLNVVYFSGGIWAVWVNRFANAGEAAVEAAGNTMEKVQLFSQLLPIFWFGVLCSN